MIFKLQIVFNTIQYSNLSILHASGLWQKPKFCWTQGDVALVFTSKFSKTLLFKYMRYLVLRWKLVWVYESAIFTDSLNSSETRYTAIHKHLWTKQGLCIRTQDLSRHWTTDQAPKTTRPHYCLQSSYARICCNQNQVWLLSSNSVSSCNSQCVDCTPFQ